MSSLLLPFAHSSVNVRKLPFSITLHPSSPPSFMLVFMSRVSPMVQITCLWPPYFMSFSSYSQSPQIKDPESSFWTRACLGTSMLLSLPFLSNVLVSCFCLQSPPTLFKSYPDLSSKLYFHERGFSSAIHFASKENDPCMKIFAPHSMEIRIRRVGCSSIKQSQAMLSRHNHLSVSFSLLWQCTCDKYSVRRKNYY